MHAAVRGETRIRKMPATISSPVRVMRDERPTVIALHCSGSSGAQWRSLEEQLGHRFAVIAPDLIGCGSSGHWEGERPFSLSEEAALAVSIIDELKRPVHLVGHSYGGAVAIRAAHERPERIAKFTLYEPVAFYALNAAGAAGQAELEYIYRLVDDLHAALNCGAFRAAAERFVNFWNRRRRLGQLPPEIRTAMMRYIPKVTLYFHAVLTEETPLSAYGRFRFPVLLMRGERGPTNTRLVAEKLAQAMRTRVESIAGAGHMGPMTHADAIAAMIVRNIDRANPISSAA